MKNPSKCEFHLSHTRICVWGGVRAPCKICKIARFFFPTGKKIFPTWILTPPSFFSHQSFNSFILNNSFHPVSMKKSELALLYFPDSTVAVATNRLMRWVHDCPPLMEELEAVGYHRSQKLLTSRQVSLIIRHLGDP